MRHFIIGFVGILTFSPFSLGFEGIVGRLEIKEFSQEKRAESSPQSSPTGSETDGRRPMDQKKPDAGSPLFEIDEVKVITKLNERTFTAKESSLRKKDLIIINLPDCNFIISSFGNHTFKLENPIKYFETEAGEEKQFYKFPRLKKGDSLFKDQLLTNLNQLKTKTHLLPKGMVEFLHYEVNDQRLVNKRHYVGCILDIFSKLPQTGSPFCKFILNIDILVGKELTTYKASYAAI